MMRAMRRLRSWPLCCLLAACAGVTPRPESADATILPVREVSSAERQQLEQSVASAMSAVLLRRFEEAEHAARDALAIDPRSARARAVIGMAILHRASLSDPPDLRDANAGEFELRLALQLAPGDPFVGWMHAVFLAETGHMSAAAAAAEQALARAGNATSNELAALLGIAGTYRYELGEERAALPHLRSYLSLRQDDATAFFRLGSSLLRIAAVPQGLKAREVAKTQAIEAATAFGHCHELAPGDEDADLAVATSLWRACELATELGDADRDKLAADARARLQQVAERFPASAEPWFRLGVIAEALKDPATAATVYRQALQRDGRHVGATLNLACLLDAQGDGGAARTLLQRLLTDAALSAQLTPRERNRVRERVGG